MAEDTDKDQETGQPEAEPKDTPEKHSDQHATEGERAALASEHPGKGNKLKGWCAWLLARKQISIPLAAVLLLLVLAAVPFTRYQLAGLFLKQTMQVQVLDSTTDKPVPSAAVTLDGKKATTDAQGKAKLSVPVGKAKLAVTKQYYKLFSREVLVPIAKPGSPLTVKLEATGRQVPITVWNKIANTGVQNATIAAENTQTKTDAKGEAVLVVPAGKQEITATITAEGYNKQEATIKVTEAVDPANTVKLTPAGKIYFLSNASGKIDLVKSDLDGANRQTILPGTGKEDKFNTVLLASRDWQYIALLSKRDGGEHAKLFLIEAANDKVTTMDEGEADFGVVGWSGDRFVYTVTRAKVQLWEPKRQALKSYHAPSKKITTLVETTAEGGPGNYATETFGGAYVLDQEILYAKNWEGYVTGKQATLNSLKADGSQKKTVKTYQNNYFNMTTAEFGEIYIQYFADNQDKYDEYHNGKVEAITLDDSQFYSGDYPVYAVSPSGSKTLWSEFRDGKHVFFVGNSQGQSGQQIGSSEDYRVYGWFTDTYVLLTRKGSEMHIMPASAFEGGVDASLKLSDYYKPNYANRGFGYGYGG